jgi:hypothetical protein
MLSPEADVVMALGLQPMTTAMKLLLLLLERRFGTETTACYITRKIEVQKEPLQSFYCKY